MLARVQLLVASKVERKRGNRVGTKQYHFQKLTPVSDSNIDVYNSAIDFSFSNGDIKNVAISGPYSAGKSSVL